MPEQTENEIDTLRRTNSELVAKSTTRKQRIAELEAANAGLTATLAERDAAIHGLTVGAPLKAMADRISNVPELWLEQFAKYYKLEMVNGELTLLSADGKAVQKDGNAIPWETKALAELLTAGDDATAKAFRAITIASKASGGASATQKAGITVPKKATMTFGLR